VTSAFRKRLFAVVCLFVISSSPAFAQLVEGQRDARKRFDSEYPEALVAIENTFSNVVSKGTLTKTKYPPGEEPTSRQYWYRFEILGENSKSEITEVFSTGEGQTEVWCRNPEKYVFRVVRAARGAGYYIQSLMPQDAGFSKAMDETVYRHLRATHCVNGVPVSRLISQPEFEVLNCEYEDDGNSQLVHVSYAFSPQQDQEMIRNGELWLSPTLGWSIVRSRSDYFVHDRPEAEAGMECVVDFDADSDFPIPAKVTITQYLDKVRIVEEFDFYSIDVGNVKPTSFTLGHYGLTEPEPPTSFPTIFVLNLVVVVVIGTIIWVRKKRASLST